MRSPIHEGVRALTVATLMLLASVVGCAAGSRNGGAPATPAAPPSPTVCATFYADEHLKGATLVSMNSVDDSPTIRGTFNDIVSSVAVSPGCTVVVYADQNYGGQQQVTFTQTAETVPPTINDQMSSYKCTCGNGAGK